MSLLAELGGFLGPPGTYSLGQGTGIQWSTVVGQPAHTKHGLCSSSNTDTGQTRSLCHVKKPGRRAGKGGEGVAKQHNAP